MFKRRWLCNYYVTLRCNSRCKFCDIWYREPQHNVREQTIAEVDANLKSLKKLGVKVIDFTGGEPLLYPHLVEALILAKKLGFYTTVTTNAILYPKYAVALRDLINVLYFSFHSHHEEEHNKTTGVKSHQLVMQSIEIAKKMRQKFYLLHTVTNENINTLAQTVAFAQNNKCVLSINICFSYFGNESLAHTLVDSLLCYRNKPYVMLNLALLRFIKEGGNQITDPICQATKNIIVISPDNCLVLPCYHRQLHRLPIDNNLDVLQDHELVKTVGNQVGKYSFCHGCKINCYMRASLFRKYPCLFVLTWLKNFREFLR